MGDAMGTIGSGIGIVSNIGNYILTPILNQLSYLFDYRQNIQNMKEKVEKLNKKKLDLQFEILEAKRNARIIGNDVVDWIQEVDKVIEMEKEIMDNEVEVQKGCFYGIFPDIKSQYSLSKKAKKVVDVVRELLLQNDGIIKKISYHAPLEPIPSTSSFIELDSRKSKENEIMEALNDNNIYVLALCGIRGVGKTTMAKIIKNKVENDKIFEKVAMVVVSQPLDLKNVQEGIAEGIDLKLKEKTIEARARRLHMSLKEIDSFLIILDDVQKKFDLQEIGIPSKSTHPRCKIILTSQNQKICKAIEDSTKFIQLDILSEEESWKLFREKCGERVDEKELHPIAKEVVKECKGLPLALVNVAAALRDSSLAAWNDALHQLKASNKANINSSSFKFI